ncbi:hypothetical protein BRADI_3g53514v3 [Brachypodium distachyon]|uniref:Uncharacterized protein n=1 Tax=Brachypodium distachyon TaxID=15368 RepID=A0A2K2D4W8_BRADI|nr:hypothetical protein BRADI_3g53514v3 [Brachypodium distachyon]
MAAAAWTGTWTGRPGRDHEREEETEWVPVDRRDFGRGDTGERLATHGAVEVGMRATHGAVEVGMRSPLPPSPTPPPLLLSQIPPPLLPSSSPTQPPLLPTSSPTPPSLPPSSSLTWTPADQGLGVTSEALFGVERHQRQWWAADVRRADSRCMRAAWNGDTSAADLHRRGRRCGGGSMRASEMAAPAFMAATTGRPWTLAGGGWQRRTQGKEKAVSASREREGVFCVQVGRGAIVCRCRWLEGGQEAAKAMGLGR